MTVLNPYLDTVTLFTQLADPSHASALFVETTNYRITYAQLSERIRKAATLFQQYGLAEGDRIVVSIADEQETILTFMALLANGLTAILLDPETKTSRTESILQMAQPKGVIADADFFDRVPTASVLPLAVSVKPEQPKKGQLFRKLLGQSTPATDSGTYPTLLQALPVGALPRQIDPETVAYILFTSGTTSDMKGVQITHQGLFSHLHTLSQVYGLTSESRILNNLLLYHADGIIQGPVLAAYQASVCVRPFAFEINRIGELLDAVYKYRITHFVAVPTMLALIQRFADGYEDSFRTSDFQFIISVSSHLEEALWRAFSERYGVRIVNVYGLTETVAGGLFSGPSDGGYRIGTVGKPVDMDARIVDEAGREVPDGEAGELLLRGNNVMKGYLHNEAATAAVLQQGWLRTGDIATRSTDGFYQITGRLKNIIVSGGVNIHPEEVTEILNTHPDVVESISFGITDEVFGERLISCVVPRSGSELTELMLTAFCRDHLEERKIPSAIYQFDSLPKGPSGKVQLSAMRDVVHQLGNRAATFGPDYAKLVMDAASQAFKVPISALKPTDTSRTIAGWDSMAHLDFVIRLEKTLGVEFDTAEIMVMNSLQNAESIARRKVSTR
ncbi:AMP-binding protein [Spirosoma gilvum]